MIKAAIVGITGFGGTHYNDLIREYETGVERRVVHGIEKIMRRTFDENRLLNEEDFAGIRPEKVIEIKEYH